MHVPWAPACAGESWKASAFFQGENTNKKRAEARFSILCQHVLRIRRSDSRNFRKLLALDRLLLEQGIHDPALASFAIAAIILALTLFLTHGLSVYVRIAYFGTMAAVAVTCLIAWVSVSWLHLTGFSADASVYLNFATGGQLDLAGLLLGGIIIGLLGVLDDVSITQASVVQELRRANPTLGVRSLYERGVKVGRDHVGSLVNTLALAYVGTALPLVLLYAQSQAPFMDILNQEVVAAELVRIIVGSIGLVLAVPFTTLVAAYYFSRHEIDSHTSPSHSHHHHH
jgi:uncharacterized membrane protein